MEEKMMRSNNNEEMEIDLRRLLGVLMDKAWLIGLAAVVCAVVVFLGTYFFVTPTYQSATMFYVDNSAQSQETSLGISSGDISASRGLVQSCIVILNTRESLEAIIDAAGVDRTCEQVKKMIRAESVDNTEIFQVVVTGPDPQEAEKIANAVADNLPARICGIIEGASVKVVDPAVAASRPSAPNYLRNTVLGFIIGLLLMAGYLVIRGLLDVTIRRESDITSNCKYPILAAIPDMENRSRCRRCGPGEKRANKPAVLVGNEISFAAAEAYKLLRTKLQFAFADEDACHVIGVSGAMTGEGKSLSAINLAYTTAQLGKRVLLMECDMRSPSLADMLPIQKAPGLSDFLVGQTHSDQLLQVCGIRKDARAFHVIPAGRIPPNPMELLSSAKMEKTVALLREKYDWIIIDLPPVGEEGDALAAAKLTDGLLVVVRQNHCDTAMLNAAIRQLEFVRAKVLGVVFNCVAEGKGRYR